MAAALFAFCMQNDLLKANARQMLARLDQHYANIPFDIIYEWCHGHSAPITSSSSYKENTPLFLPSNSPRRDAISKSTLPSSTPRLSQIENSSRSSLAKDNSEADGRRKRNRRHRNPSSPKDHHVDKPPKSTVHSSSRLARDRQSLQSNSHHDTTPPSSYSTSLLNASKNASRSQRVDTSSRSTASLPFEQSLPPDARRDAAPSKLSSLPSKPISSHPGQKDDTQFKDLRSSKPSRSTLLASPAERTVNKDQSFQPVTSDNPIPSTRPVPISRLESNPQPAPNDVQDTPTRATVPASVRSDNEEKASRFSAPDLLRRSDGSLSSSTNTSLDLTQQQSEETVTSDSPSTTHTPEPIPFKTRTARKRTVTETITCDDTKEIKRCRVVSHTEVSTISRRPMSTADGSGLPSSGGLQTIRKDMQSWEHTHSGVGAVEEEYFNNEEDEITEETLTDTFLSAWYDRD